MNQPRRSPRFINMTENKNLLSVYKDLKSITMLKVLKIQIKIAKNTTDKYQRIIELTEVFQIFNKNFELLKRLNKPEKPYTFETLFRKLYTMTFDLLKQISIQNDYEVELLDEIYIFRNKFTEYGHIHFDDIY